jgi:20S proteasome alpha/beta subunit
VTVCIACICGAGNAIVAVCDSTLSTGYTSSDRATLKAVRVSNNWAFMYAATDVSPLVPIRQRLRHELKSRSNNLSEITSAFQSVYHEQILMKAKDFSLIPQETSLGVILMGFGYDDELKPHIFTAEDPQGKIDYHDIVGFQTIGAGAQTASSILYFYGQNPKTPLALTIYHASAAKFMAESASDVGKHTSVIVFRPSGEAVLLCEPDIESLRAMWDRDGKPRVPANASEEVSKLYAGEETLHRVINSVLKEKGLPPRWSENED